MEDVKSVDSLITARNACSDKIDLHRKRANYLFNVIVIIITFFGCYQGSFFLFNIKNQREINATVRTLDSLNRRLDDKMRFDLFLNETFEAKLKASQTTSDNFSLDIKDSVAKSKREYTLIAEDLRKIPGELTSSIFKVDNTTTYILYGIFILVFGVVTSFYRFHVKETAKYEHFLLGFYRIGVAGELSSTKFDDEVKIALSQDAFLVETKGAGTTKGRTVESPLPGHPTSDIATGLLNKILENIEFIAKPKKD